MDIDLAPLNPDSPIPLYHQLFEELKSRIRNGDIPTGNKIPSEKDLSSHLGVSRITVKRAVNELATLGLVTRQRGSGTTVTLNTDVPVEGGFESMHESIRQLRKSTRGQLLDRHMNEPSSEARANLQVKPKTQIESFAYVLTLNEAPFSYVTACIPAQFCEAINDSDVEKTALITLLIESGIIMGRAEQTISAVAANPAQAKALSMDIGQPLLQIHCIMIDHSGQPLMDITSYFPPQIYQYQMTLTKTLT